MTKITPEHQLLIDKIKVAHRELVSARAELEARLRAQMAAELAEIELRRARTVRLAVLGGVKKSVIAREVFDTDSRSTVYRLLGIAESAAVNPIIDITTGQAVTEFEEAGDGVVIVRPKEGDLAPLLAMLDTSYDALAEEQREARVSFLTGSLYAITPAWSQEGGRHPVVARVREWATEKGLAA